MPRSSSRSSRSSRQHYSYSNSSYTKSRMHKQSSITPSQSTNPIQHNSVTAERPGFFSNVWQGFGFGTGSAIANNMFRNNPIVEHKYNNTPPPVSVDPCNKLKDELLTLDRSSYRYSELKDKFEELCSHK